MKQCRICGTDLEKDLFAYVAQKPVCCVCTASFVGGDFSDERIAAVRKLLKLPEGEYLGEAVIQGLTERMMGRMQGR